MARPTVLIADDNKQLLKALEVRLAAAGFDVVLAQDAYQAVDIANRRIPDVLVLDINMPAGTGFSVQERISNSPALKDTPVIYLTGEKSASIQNTAYSMGAFAILHKPCRLGDLLDLVHAAIAARSESSPNRG